LAAKPDAAAVTAVVLGGGHSRRYGQEKGLANWRGLSLVDHVLQRLPQPRRGTVLVLRAEQSDDWAGRDEVTIIHDHQAHEGPLRGVIRALEYLHDSRPASWAWLVACDQPLVNADLLRALTAEVTPATLAVIPEWNGRLQPLTGLYHVDAGARLRTCQNQGEAALVRAVETIGYQKYSTAQCRRHDPRGLGFMNINRPADLDELERMLK
jgi:molybdopterin-guanine dinucleotide biosynthesis protein A